MSDPHPHQIAGSGAGPKVFRIRARMRKAMVGSAIMIIATAVGLAAFSIFSLLRFRPSELPAFRVVTFGGLVSAVTLVVAGVYMSRYWSEYRIVLDGQAIAREGQPHPVDRRVRIAYADIARVTHGTRGVLKVIPKEGDPLAVGLKGLEGEPLDLLMALRERVPEGRFDTDLETSIFKGASPDRAGYILGIALILATAISLGGITLRERVLERTAWHELSGPDGGDRIRLVDTGDDGSVWIVAERYADGAVDEVVLTQLRSNGNRAVWDLAAESALREAIAIARDEHLSVIDSLAIDSHGRPWIVFSGYPAAFHFDGQAWNRVQAKSSDVEFAITDLVRAGDHLWAQVPEHNAIFSIDVDSLETFRIGPLRWEQERETIEFRPIDLSGSRANGAVILGEFSFGGPGLIALAEDGTFEFTTGLSGGPSPISWTAGMARLDGLGRVHTVVASPDACVEGRGLIKIGVAQADTPWQWRDIVYPANCDVSPLSDGIQIDATGRVWVRLSSGGVIAFPAPSGESTEDAVEPLAVYTRDNSGFNEGELVMASDGRMLGVDEYRLALVTLDARGSDLPMPLPGWVAWILAHPYVLQPAVVLVVLPMLIAYHRRNFKR